LGRKGAVFPLQNAVGLGRHRCGGKGGGKKKEKKTFEGERGKGRRGFSTAVGGEFGGTKKGKRFPRALTFYLLEGREETRKGLGLFASLARRKPNPRGREVIRKKS